MSLLTPTATELHRALHSVEGAGLRWAQRRAQGLDDVGLRKALANEFGTYGGFSGPEGRFIDYKGGSDPAVWFDEWNGDISQRLGRHILKGRALIDATRRLLGLPKPIKTGDNLRLF